MSGTSRQGGGGSREGDLRGDSGRGGQEERRKAAKSRVRVERARREGKLNLSAVEWIESLGSAAEELSRGQAMVENDVVAGEESVAQAGGNPVETQRARKAGSKAKGEARVAKDTAAREVSAVGVERDPLVEAAFKELNDRLKTLHDDAEPLFPAADKNGKVLFRETEKFPKVLLQKIERFTEEWLRVGNVLDRLRNSSGSKVNLGTELSTLSLEIEFLEAEFQVLRKRILGEESRKLKEESAPKNKAKVSPSAPPVGVASPAEAAPTPADNAQPRRASPRVRLAPVAAATIAATAGRLAESAATPEPRPPEPMPTPAATPEARPPAHEVGPPVGSEMVKAIWEDPEKQLEVLSGQLSHLARNEAWGLRSNEAAYAEYQSSALKKRLEELRLEITRELERLASLPKDQRSHDSVIALEKKVYEFNFKLLRGADDILMNEKKFPPLKPEVLPQDAASVEKRKGYIEKVNALAGRSKALRRLRGGKWKRFKARLGADSITPQQALDEITAAHPLVKAGESISSISAEDSAARKQEFLKVLKGRGIKPDDAEAVYEAAMAKAEYQASLVALGSSMMDSERKRAVMAMERVLGLPFDKWPEDKKAELEKQLTAYKAEKVVNRVVFEEHEILAKANAESLPPVEKGRLRRLLDWYRGLSPGGKLALSTAFVVGVTGLGAALGIVTLAGAATYTGWRLARSAGAMVGMILLGKGHDAFVDKRGFVEKAEQKKNEAIEALRRNFSPENVAALQSAYTQALEERARTERRILLSKMAITGAAGFMMAYGLSHTNFATSGWGEGGALGAGADASLEGTGGGAGLVVEVQPKDTLWGILRGKLEAHGALEGLSMKEQNDMIAALTREAADPEKMKAIGIRENVDLIYPGQHLKLGPLLENSKVPGVAEHFPAGSGVGEVSVGPQSGLIIEPGGFEAPDASPAPTDTSGLTFEDWDDAPVASVASAEDLAGGRGRISLGAAETGTGAEAAADAGRSAVEAYIPTDPMTRLWEMQHPGETPPDSFLRQVGEMRAHGIRLENTEMFKGEVEYRIETGIREIFGRHGLASGAWRYWSGLSAAEVLRVPNTYLGGQQARELKEYLRFLASQPNVEPPYTPGWRHETVEKFIFRAEAKLLADELRYGS